MTCYRKGGCGPYEMYSCDECPASKEEYLNRYKTNEKEQIKAKWSLNCQKDPVWPFCTNCGAFANAEMKNPIGIKHILEPVYSNFCPNCGADMTGAYGKVKNISYKGIKNE